MGYLPANPSEFVRELKRRRVFRVAAMYAVVGWLAVQVSATAFPHLHLPGWTITLVIVLVIVGFPLALILAWAYDITPEGVVRTEVLGADAPAAAHPRNSESREERSDTRNRRETTAQREPSGRPVDLEKTRLMVLPFRMLRPDAETEFLTFSLPDAITSSLSEIRSLVVRSHLAALRYAREVPDLKAIAAEADIDILLTGTLVRVGEQLRVSVQLTEAMDGTLLWTQASQVSIGDLFQLQDQLTRRIVESLDLPLTAREHQILRRDVPATARAYEFYLRANQVAYEVGQWGTARDLYLQSLTEDPNYAPALARLARCYRLLAKWAEDEWTYRENLAASEAAFNRALEISPDLSIAHNFYAQLEVELGRAQDAMLRLLGRARENGGDPELFAGLVHVLRFCGMLDASLAAHEQARRLDPKVTTSVSHTYYMMGDYSHVLNETFGDIGYIAPLALATLGRSEEAVEMLREWEQTTRGSGIQPYVVSLRAMLEEKREESLAAMEQVTAHLRDPEGLYYMVRQMAYLGETERASAEFERVVEAGFFCYPTMASDSWLDPLRGIDRFRKALAQAEARHREAAKAFVAAGGDALLGTTSTASPARLRLVAPQAM